MSPSGLRPSPAAEPVRRESSETETTTEGSSDKRNTAPPAFDLEEFAKEVMADAPEGAGVPDPPDSEVRAVSHTSKTAPPPPVSLYPERSAISSSSKKSSLSSLHEELDELLACRDHRAALVVAEQILADEPDDIRAKAGVLRCHGALEEMYAASLGSLERVPRVAVPREDIPTLALDHISGFILALIDGSCSLDTILDMASMPRLDALRVLHELVQQGTVTLD